MCNKENFEFYTDEQVNTLQTYIEEQYTLDGTSKHLIRNILEYVAAQGDDEENILYMLTNLLDGIGITEDEIVNAVVSELDYATKKAMEEELLLKDKEKPIEEKKSLLEKVSTTSKTQEYEK